MSDIYRTMHLHELQNELDKTDKNKEFEKYELLKNYIEKGGYKSPAEIEDNKVLKITNKYFKLFLYVTASMGLINGFYILSKGFNPVLLVGITLNIGLIWSIYIEHKISKTIVITLGVITFISAIASLFVIYYSTDIKADFIADLSLRLALSIAMLMGAQRYMRMVLATSNKFI